jgi:arginase
VRRSIVVLGSPTALGGHVGGMERTPAVLRQAGLIDRIRAEPALAKTQVIDAGDAPNDPGWAPDPDPRAKNRALIGRYLPVLAGRVEAALVEDPEARLHLIGGDCTSHAGAMAGLLRVLEARLGHRPRLGIAWFDAHGDFNTPDTTPSGNVWGMPFAMLLGRGDADLVTAAAGPTAREDDAALLGGQVLDERESRMLAASQVSQFGAGMLGTPAGQAALAGWAATVASRCDGLYVAFDLDAIDETEGLSLTMPEPGGISLATAIASVRLLAAAMPVAGIGTTAAMERPGVDLEPTVAAIAALVAAALGSA